MIIWHVFSIYVYLYTYIRSIWLQTVLERTRRRLTSELRGVLEDMLAALGRWQSSKLRDALGGRDRANLDENLEMVLLATLGDGNRANLEMEMEQT
jgi:hypothetical protein